jgi:hypothetical protein
MTKPDTANPLDDRFIDQIVDGALTPAQLRVAIERLDQHPDGWRRCAIAFLEAQCFSESFRSLEPAVQPLLARQPFSSPPSARAGLRRRWIWGPVAAASVAASFALGWAGHAARPWSGERGSVIARATATPQPPADGSRPVLHERDRDDVRDSQNRTAVRFEEPRSVPTVKEVVRAVASLHVGPRTTGADVPILAGPGINEQWLKNQPPPVTEYDQVALQRQGYQVDQRRQFYTTILADGQRVAVPVDQVQIRFTGNDPL